MYESAILINKKAKRTAQTIDKLCQGAVSDDKKYLDDSQSSEFCTFTPDGTDRNRFCGDVVLDSVNMSFKEHLRLNI